MRCQIFRSFAQHSSQRDDSKSSQRKQQECQAKERLGQQSKSRNARTVHSSAYFLQMAVVKALLSTDHLLTALHSDW